MGNQGQETDVHPPTNNNNINSGQNNNNNNTLQGNNTNPNQQNNISNIQRIATNKVLSNYIKQNRANNMENQIPKKMFKYRVTKKQLVDAFKKYAIKDREEYLNKSLFNNAIADIFSFQGFPAMHFTYLSERMYSLLDESKDDKIQLEEFLDGFSGVLSNKDYRDKCKDILN